MRVSFRCTVVLFLMGALGCGPIVSGVRIVDADIALSAAKTAGAMEAAPYEYAAAERHLHKAREEHGYSDFAGARRFADEALKYAVKARKKAVKAQKAQQPAVLPSR